MKKLFILSLVFFLANISWAQTNELIFDTYNLEGGCRGAETIRVMIGSPNDDVPILYYLSYNACKPKDVWMIHLVLWTDFKVRIPYEAKVLIKKVNGGVLELKERYADDGLKQQECKSGNKIYNKFISSVHCLVSYDELLQILKEGIKKIRIQTKEPNGYLEREYSVNEYDYLSDYLRCAHKALLDELKPVDFYENF